MIKATKAQIEEFRESLLWQDIVEELTQLAKNAQLEYDIVGEPHVDDEGHKIVPNESETLIHLGDIKGRRKAVNYFLDIPNILLQSIELQETNVEVSDGTE
jgi:hypothetical protein